MTFPHARKNRPGNDIDEVDEFLEEARRAYTAEQNWDQADATMTSERIRTTGFTVRKGGYAITNVDAALERLEDAFAARERERERARVGDEAWFAEAREAAQTILDRVVRPEGRRFQRVSILSRGYSVADVDAFADRIALYFQSGVPLSTEDVRTVAFRPQRGGYREVQVDLVLDEVTRVMLAVA
jgi:DivIVA domain-containing protein